MTSLDYVVDYLKFDEGNTTSSTMTTDYTYTNLGQLSEIKYVKDTTNTVLEKYNYTYDLSGNIKTENTMHTTHSGTSSSTKAYTYDSLYRLTKTVFNGDETTYTYDQVGNRTSEKSRQTEDYYDKYHYYNEFDQLERVTTNTDSGAMDTEVYTYDTRGAMTYSNQRNYYWFEGLVYTFHDDGSYTTEWVEEWRLTTWLESNVNGG